MDENNRRGRPKLEVDVVSIVHMLNIKFSVPKIADLNGVSISTVRRIMDQNNIKVKDFYSGINDDELKESIASIMVEQPNTGTKLMKGMLLTKFGIRVPEERLRRTMREVDPDGVENRRRRNRAIVRRSYFVPFAHSLWHIDGNLKCVRYRIVIRGAIDGKSRNCIYLEAGSNNLATSSLRSFFNGVRRYGTIPERTRNDKGGENVLLARFMITVRGPGRGSHLTGRSVHNQRIERFWRDVNKLTSTFYDTFWKLEREGLLDIDNQNLLFILHHVYLSRLNQSLEEFRRGWNSHPLSTESNYSPEQLLLLHRRPKVEVLNEDEVNHLFVTCMREHDPQFLLDDPIRNPSAISHALSSEAIAVLSQIDVMKYSEQNARDIFIECVEALRFNGFM